MYYNIMSAHNCFIAEISIQERPDPAEVMYQIKGVRLLCLCKSDLKILLLQINSKLKNQSRLRNCHLKFCGYVHYSYINLTPFLVQLLFFDGIVTCHSTSRYCKALQLKPTINQLDLIISCIDL